MKSCRHMDPAQIRAYAEMAERLASWKELMEGRDALIGEAWRAGLSGAEISERMGIAKMTVTKVLNGGRGEER